MRLAVELGAKRIRLAVVDVQGGRARVLASRSVAEALGDAVADELVVVHPPDWTDAAVRAAAATVAGHAGSVRTRSSALAAATEATARTPVPPGPLAVIQADPAGVTATVLSGERALACRRPPGGAPPDALAAVTAAAGIPPHALTGGVLLLAPDPGRWLAPLADLVGEPPLVPPDPDRLAVLGALRPSVLPTARRTPSPTPPPPALADGLLAPPPRRRRRRRARAALAALAVPTLAAVTAGLAAAVVEDPPPPAHTAGILAQYDYTVSLPAGWHHSGGDPDLRRTLLTPAGAPDGSDLISIEQHPLGYDGIAERDRAVRELAERLRLARATGADLTDLDTDLDAPTPPGARGFSTYRQRQPRRGAEVDWYVLFDRDAQLSVGCQRTPAGADAVRAACAEVIASIRLHPP
ncbi:type VII secretion-associated protein [Pseudonocardia acaciae]|uniref:type VII secretion-associated protein n=1 Tax=Pseudonocardia acaciae TaxID=551276 RepID=UPI00048AE37D|nr:type VII secretion-associated protein [Pseudonocardia acaciae]